MRKIKTGDEVEVIAGKDKGKRGRVIRFRGRERVVLENINLVKRHTKGNPMQNTPGGIIEKEASVHLSNLALADPKDGQPTKIGYKFLEDGRKVRFAKRSGEVIDV